VAKRTDCPNRPGCLDIAFYVPHHAPLAAASWTVTDVTATNWQPSLNISKCQFRIINRSFMPGMEMLGLE
jgi:hypothetical protein